MHEDVKTCSTPTIIELPQREPAFYTMVVHWLEYHSNLVLSLLKSSLPLSVRLSNDLRRSIPWSSSLRRI